MTKTIGDIPGVLHIRDDILVHGKTRQEHNAALLALLRRFRECNLTLRKSKCKFNLSEINFFGFIFAADGMTPDPEKVDTVRFMDPPTNVSEVRSFISMAAFLSRFIPKFSSITALLRRLTEKNAKWKRGEEDQSAFEFVRYSISEHTTLSYYDVGKDIGVYLDAGPSGLAAILVQLSSDGIWRTITLASQSLTKIERKYSQIEKEALCARWACEKLYMYSIGSKFVLITDHQPLLLCLIIRTADHLPESSIGYSTSNDLIMLWNISQVNLIPLIICLAIHFDTTLNTIRMQRKGNTLSRS